jgi:hypothetical protein
MLARHPITGKDIRIVQMDTSIWRDQKTLVWFNGPPAVAAAWERWDIGTTSVAAAVKLQAAGLTPDVVLCLDESPTEIIAWLKRGAWKSARVIAVPKSLVDRIGIEELRKLRIANMLCLDELHDLYPFVGEKWNGTVEDAKILVALSLHSGRTFPCAPSTRPLLGLRVEADLRTPQSLWFVTQYYKSDTTKRRQEIDACLTKNLDCSVIDKVVLLNETACAPKHAKLQEIVVGKRLTYADTMRWIYEKAPRDTMIVFANADIFLDAESWRTLWSTDIETVPKFLALLRWDVETESATASAKLFGPRADSQDTWVISSNAVKAVDWDWDALNFPFGKGGCDNAITLELFKKRFLIANPALTLKTYHLHASGVRTYNPRDIIDKPAYLHINPTGLHDMKPVSVLENPTPFKFTPFARPIRGPLSAAQAATFCTMVGRSTQGAVTLDAASSNMWSPPPVPLYRMKDVFQTREGLAYTYNSILVGKSKASVAAWSASTLSSLATSIPVGDAMIAPLPDAIAADPARYILEYMSKVFLLRQTFGSATGEFWCSKDPASVEAIKMFAWPKQEIPVLAREENFQAWCSEAAMWPYNDVPQGFISREEVGALRSAFGLGGWKEAVAEKKLVVVVDEKWITDEAVDTLETALQGIVQVKVVWAGRSSLDTCLHAMRGAWGVLMYSKQLAPWCWVLPRGAYVWEIQSEMEPVATLLHTACAAELEHRLAIVPKGAANAISLQSLLDKLVKGIKEATGIGADVKPVSPAKQTILVPANHTGFYAHAGDSFREVVDLWAKRGYVDRVASPSVHQIWLGSMGDVLLYDRPTHEWLAKAPAAEKSWRVALFGNPPPVSTPNAKSWTFWPRRPALVEDIVASGGPTRPWESRGKSLVFYGRSENAVQKSRRTAADWSSACDEFVHVDGLKPYPYSQQEYLERLTDARYGLCLAGYGYKCHREIECMAMGCVPIVAPEVDMDNYADPPQEGLHYFRATDPAMIAGLIQDTTAERWTVMSVACRDWWTRNASVDGMWELTQRLLEPAAEA